MTMKKTCLFLMLMLPVAVMAQKSEIKYFEKTHKDLIKELKSSYKANVEVKMTDNGTFYFELSGKGYDGKIVYTIADEMGNLIGNEYWDRYRPIDNTDEFFVNRDAHWGVVSPRGYVILPTRYTTIEHCSKFEGGKNSKGIYQPRTQEVYVASEGALTHTFFSADGKTVLATHEGMLKDYKNAYFTITNAAGGKNSTGLLSLEGKLLFPLEYSNFYVDDSDFIRTEKTDGDLSLMGGKSIKEGGSQTEIPTIFYYVSNNRVEGLKVKLHRDNRFEKYDPNKQYVITYLDEGERLYDGHHDEKVIAYYEGEGYGKPWGDYFMGMAAYKIGMREEKKMDNAISTLKGKNYSLPLKNPEKYQFSNGTMMNMYLQSQMYLERYIEKEGKEGIDSAKVKEARRARGEVVTHKNGLAQKESDYATAYAAATERYATDQRRAAQQRAEQEAASQAVANGILNLFGGGSRQGVAKSRR